MFSGLGGLLGASLVPPKVLLLVLCTRKAFQWVTTPLIGCLRSILENCEAMPQMLCRGAIKEMTQKPAIWCHWSVTTLLQRGVHDLQKEAKLGAEENVFFFDEERKIWRERGAAVPVAAAPLPPPPTAHPPGSSAPSAGAIVHHKPVCAQHTHAESRKQMLRTIPQACLRCCQSLLLPPLCEGC